MSAPTKSRDSKHDNAVASLNQLRLDRNWSYNQLADDMERAGHAVAAKTLFALLTKPEQKPYDRTLYQITKYLEVLERERAEETKPRKAAAGAR
jgi:hypothetical protein